METDHNVRLTSAEIGQLWSSYMADTMSNCVLRYFNEKLEDTEIRPVVQYALDLTEKHIDRLQAIFASERFPIPAGFTDHDVDVKAPKLFSDTFILEYVRHMAKSGLPLNGMALSMSAREDVRDYYSENMASTTELYNKAARVLLSKGLFIRAPYIAIPDGVEYVEQESFIGGFLGEQRHLIAQEIGQLYMNIQTNAIGRLLMLGFGQVTKLEQIRSHFLRGAEIAKKHIEVLHTYLLDNELPTPTTWDSDVLDSTVAPFSDKLMMFHTSLLVNFGYMNYSAAVSSSLRRDLAVNFIRLGTEALNYGQDGIKLMISNGWLEQAPKSTDPKEVSAISST